MTQAHLAHDITNWGVYVSFYVALLFPFVVRFIWDWLQSDWGWNVIMFDLAIAAALLPAWLYKTFGVNPAAVYFIWLDAVAIWSIPVNIAWRLVIIYKIQRHGGRRASTRSQRVPAEGEPGGN